MLYYLYSIRRHIRRHLRRIFGGETPDWATDAYKAFGTVNIVELVPTLAAILIAPNHFFRRIGLTLKKRSSGLKQVMHKTPVSFVTSVFTLIVAAKAISKFVAPAKAALAAVLICLPVLIPLVCLFLIPLIYLSFSSFNRGAVARKANFDQRLRYARIPLSPSTYRNLDLSQTGWSILYFYGYFISFPILIVGSFGFVAFMLGFSAFHANWHRGWDDLFGKFTSLFIWSGPSAWLVSVMLSRIVIYPYSSALLYSLKRPTAISRAIEVHWLNTAGLRLYRTCALFRNPTGKPSKWTYRRNGPNVTRETVRTEFLAFRDAWQKIRSHWNGYVIRFKIPEAEQDAELNELLTTVRFFSPYGLDVVQTNFSADQFDEFLTMWDRVIQPRIDEMKKKRATRPPLFRGSRFRHRS